jgi:hypothetical protein
MSSVGKFGFTRVLARETHQNTTKFSCGNLNLMCCLHHPDLEDNSDFVGGGHNFEAYRPFLFFREKQQKEHETRILQHSTLRRTEKLNNPHGDFAEFWIFLKNFM